MSELLERISVVISVAGIIGIMVGELYWLWSSVAEFGSFGMFVMGLFPLFIAFTGPAGLYSLIFGYPSWMYSWFG